MQITVFGASGKVGRQVVALALEQGIAVTAFVHRTNPFENEAQVMVVRGDITDAAAVAEAIRGSQVVISTLGSWGTKEKNIVSSGARAIVPAMEQQGIKRLITLTGDAARWSGDKPTLVDKVTHTVLGLMAGKILKDGEAHLEILDASSLQWTSLRSPVMTGIKSSKYNLVAHSALPIATIPRQAVAQAIIDQLDATDQLRQAPILR
ncbi:MAG: NAD(P)H-binding protein [Patescibacteria group bacterium]|nr:NAD(P)H-binding protein [Patescibacteria group bacterium]